MSKITITQVRSKIGSTLRQKRTLEALGFSKLNQTIEVNDTPQIRGMIDKVKHLLEIKDN